MTVDAVGGVWTYAVELISGLASRGVRISLAIMGPRPAPEQVADLAAIAGVEIYQRDCKLEWMEGPWADVESAGSWLLSLERSLRPDLVHLNDYAHAAMPWRSPVLAVAHSCVLSWWQAVKGGAAPEAWNEYRRRVAAGLEAADLVVGVSGSMLSELDRLYGLSGERRVIWNSRSSALFRPAPKREIILAAGRLWDEAKNAAVLEKVAPDLPWPVYVAGEKRSPDGAGAEFRNVRLLGRLAPVELSGWFSQASIYVHPARYEPFGLSVLEAALSRCALVLSDIPSLREIWDGCALFVSPHRPEALADALQSLIASAALRETLAARAYDRALGMNPDAMTEQYLEAYAAAQCNKLAPVDRQESRLCAS